MGRLVFSAITSVDGFVADADGGFAWAAPDPEVHWHVNDAERGVGTYLYGRRIYQIMTFWSDPPDLDAFPPAERDFAHIWQAAEKVVYSTTLEQVTTPRTRLERTFDPDAVRALVADADGEIGIAGPGLAAHAFRAGLVDEVRLYVCPVAVGGGTPWLHPGIPLGLTLKETHRFTRGDVFLRYDVTR